MIRAIVREYTDLRATARVLDAHPFAPFPGGPRRKNRRR